MLLINTPILPILVGYCHQTLNIVPNTQFIPPHRKKRSSNVSSKSFLFPKGWSLVYHNVISYCALIYPPRNRVGPIGPTWKRLALPRQVQRSKKFHNIDRPNFASSGSHDPSCTGGATRRASPLVRSHARDSLASLPLALLPLPRRSPNISIFY